MKRIISITLLILTFLSLQLKAQVFTEDFESTVGMTSSPSGSWAINTRLHSQGLKCDSTQVEPDSSNYLTTTLPINTSGKYSVYLSFDQICKVEIYDTAFIEVSNDNGNTWHRLVSSDYLGTGLFGNIGNRFHELSYPSWGSISIISPDQSWWKSESFDISSYAANSTTVKIRFGLIDGNHLGGVGRAGWFIDNIIVTAALSELIPPSITLLNPIVEDTVYSNAPVSVSAEITDASTVDSALCIINVSPDGITDTLTMALVSGDTYNCQIPFYGFGRTTHYSIRAVDGSAAHNVATTSVKSYIAKYTPTSEAIIGTGTTNSSFPFYTNYKDAKTQILFTAAELNAAGAFGGNINSLAFDVVSADPAAMNGFNINIKSTSLTTLSGLTAFETTGFTSVYSPSSYTVPATGWQEIIFTTPFLWNGSSNIIIEICYDNSAYTSNSTVKSTSASGKTYAQKSDTGSGCTFTTGSTQTNRPNIKLNIVGSSELTNDIGVKHILNPTSGVVAGNDFEVKVDLYNFGIDTIRTAQINWTYDGVSQTPYTLSSQDSIMPGANKSPIILDTITATLGAHHIIAWSDLPNGSGDFNYLNDTAKYSFVGCTSTLSGIYTIGGSGASYATFNDALLAMDQCGISGPVVFNVNSGNYNEQININAITGISPTNTVTFQSTSLDSSLVNITYDATSASDNYVVKIDNISNITFKKLGFTALDADFANVFVLENDVQNISLENNIIKTANSAVLDNDNMFLISGTVGNNITIKNNSLLGATRSIVLNATAPRTFWKINNNIIHGNYTSAIKLDSAVSVEIMGNNIASDSSNCVANYKAIIINGNSGTAKIKANSITTCQTSTPIGIELNNNVFDITHPCIVANNMILLRTNATSTDLVSGIKNNLSSNINYYFNTINITGTQSNSASLSLIGNYSDETHSINIINNIFANNAGGYLYYIDNVDTNLWSCDNNNLWNNNSNGDIAKLGSSLIQYADWANESGATNFSNINPYFISSTDLHIVNNLMNGIARPISGITYDIDGQLRNTSTPDIGADEFDPSPYDATLVEILSSVGGCGLSNEVVKIKIKNIGSVAINGNFNASYKLNNNTTVTESITAIIAAGSIYEYSFTNTVNLDVYSYGTDSTFNLLAWVNLQNDPIANNDSASMSILSGYAPMAPTVSDTSINYGDSILLTATSNDNIVWFESLTSTNPLASDSVYNTGVLYDTTTYWVGASAGVGGEFQISEIVQYKTATGATSPYPSYLPTSEFDGIEISNIGTSSMNLGGYTINIYVSSSVNFNYTFPANTIINSESVAIALYGSGFTVGPSGNNVFLIGTNSSIYSSTATAYWLTDPSGNVVDAFSYRGGLFPATSGVTTTDFTGSLTSSNTYAGAIRNISDNNLPSDWDFVHSTSATTGSFGNYNNQMQVLQSGSSCHSSLVPLTVNVLNIPLNDIGVVELIQPISGTVLPQDQAIEIVMKNFGANTQSIMPFAYSLNNASIVYDTLYRTTVSSDTAHFISNNTIDLSQYGTYNFKIFTNLNGDSDNSNDTISTIITNDSLVYCISKSTSTGDSRINEIILEGINNNTDDATCVSYSDFTNLSTVLSRGLSYQISGSFGSCGGNYSKGAKAYIDFNNDGDFSDANEEIASFSNSSTSDYTQVVTFNIPSDATIGDHLLRIVLRETPGTNNASISPCGTYSYGETEDYTVTIMQQIQYDAAITALTNIADTTNEGASITPKVYLKNYGSDTLNSFEINYKVNNGTPVVYNYTSQLLPGGIDSVSLVSFSSPSADVNLCVYTYHPQDNNNLNDIICTDYYAIPSKDAELLQIANVDKYCGMQYDTIRVQITNTGVQSINSASQTVPTTISYKSNSLSPITETITAVIAPGDTVWYTFSNLVYVGSNSLMDSLYNITAWINYSGDNYPSNDTITSLIESIHTPDAPVVVSPVVIPYGTYATVNASSTANDTILWYANTTATTELFGGNSHTNTWLSMLDTTYYAQAGSGGLGGDFYIGLGTDVNTGTGYPTPFVNHFEGNKQQYLILATELTAMGVSPGNITDIAFDVTAINACPTLNDYEMKMGNSTQSILNNFENNLSVVFSALSGYQPTTGWNNHILSTPFYWDGTSNIVIEVCSNNPGWISNGNASVNSTNTGFNSTRYYRADAQGVCATSNTGTSSTKRPNMKIVSQAQGCASARVPVLIDVLAPSNCDVGISNLIAPTTSIYMTNSEIIKATVQNYGSVDQTAIPVNYQINGGTIISETVSVPALSSVDYSFTTPADFSMVGQQYNINIFTSLACDTTTVNNEFSSVITNLTPSYCNSTATSTSYHDISNITFSGIDNTSPSPYDKMYTDYSNTTPAFLPPGTNKPFAITITSASSYSSGGYLKVYIDFNKDGSFDPITEKAFGISYTGVTSSNPVTKYGSIHIPASVVVGNSLMRVVVERNASESDVDPCGTYTYGETEDYSVVFSNIIADDAAVEYVTADNITTLSSIPVSARIKNYGSSTINSLDVSYTVNGGTPVTITYTTPINSGDFADIALGNASIAGGMNNICVYTTLAGDINTFNDQKCKNVFKEASVNLSYSDDFEGNILWFNDTLINEWEHGVPSMTNINSAHSPSNVWAIDLDNNYDNSATQLLYTPEFIIPNNVDSAVLKFWHYYNCQPNNDGAYIQYQKNNGPWIALGYLGDPKSTNWYDDLFGGVHKWSGNSNGWVESKYVFDLNGPDFSNTNTLKLRYVFYSNASSNSYDGWAIDDFSLTVALLPNDAGVTAITSPISGTIAGQTATVSIDVKNYGNNTLSSIPVYYTLNGGAQVTETFTPTGGLAIGSTQTYTFTTDITAPFSNFNICAGTNIVGDPNSQNNEVCSNVAVSAPPIDASVTNVGFIQLSSTSSTTTNIFDPVQVIAEIKNLGTTALTTMPISYNVGGTIVNEVWTGNINPNEVDTFQFAQTYNSPIGIYSICVEVNALGDNNTINDELCITIVGDAIDDVNNLTFEVFQNEPNPAFGDVRINYIVPNNGDINFELINTLGQIIYTKEQASFTGKNTLKINADNLSNGVYYYSIIFNDNRITRKLIVNN